MKILCHSLFPAVLAGSSLLPLSAQNTARPPAASFARPDSAGKSPDARGFIQRWLILEPVKSDGLTESVVQAAVKAEAFSGLSTAVPRDGDKLKFGETELTWHAMDTKGYNVNLYHFAYALGKPTSNVLFWAVTTINCPEDMQNVRLSIGSNAASIWWVNGQEVIGLYNDRQSVVDDGVSKKLTLKKGPNVVRCAIINAGGATDFCARLLDAGDKPLTAYTVSVGELAK